VLFLLGSVRESVLLGSPYLIELSSALQPIAIAYFVAAMMARKSLRVAQARNQQDLVRALSTSIASYEAAQARGAGKQE